MLLAACFALAADPPPDSDIFLAELNLGAGVVGTPRNLTSRAGYDNQPSFLPDGSALLYVADSEAGPTDVFRYTLATGATERLTTSAEAEFSPTPIDGGFSAVRVGAPNAEVEPYTESQQLWRFGTGGAAVANLLPSLRRIGYHAWIDAGTVAVVLVGPNGEPPLALERVDVATGARTPLAPNVGRSLVGAGGRLYFVDKADPKRWLVSSIAAGEAAPTVLVETPPNLPGEPDELRSEDFRVLPGGALLMAHGSRLLRWRPGGTWETFAVLPGVGGDIKRLALSPDGTKLAFVVQRHVGK